MKPEPGERLIEQSRQDDQELREAVWRLGRHRPCSWRRFWCVYLVAAILLVILLAATADGAISDCIDATCRVTAGNDRGTGCVFKVDDTRVFVITNAHVVGNSPAVKCEFWQQGYQSIPMAGRVVARTLNDRCDAAVIALDVKSFGGRVPKPIPVAPRGTLIAPGRTIVSVGCANGAWATGWKGHVIGYPGGDMHFRPPPADGRSGSAIFDAEGTMIVGLLRARAIVSGKGIACTLESLYVGLGATSHEVQFPICPNCPPGGLCPPGGSAPGPNGRPYILPYRRQQQAPGWTPGVPQQPLPPRVQPGSPWPGLGAAPPPAPPTPIPETPPPAPEAQPPEGGLIVAPHIGAQQDTGPPANDTRPPGTAELRAEIVAMQKDLKARSALWDEIAEVNQIQRREEALRRPIAPGVVRGSSVETPASSKPSIPWGLILTGVASATGVGLPLWAIMALRGARAVRRIRKQRPSGYWHPPPQTEPPPVPKPPDPVPEEVPAGVDFPHNPPRDTTEAEQFLRLAELEGRDPLHDGLIGRFALDELDDVIDRGGPEKDWATQLKRTLEDRFNAMVPLKRTPTRTEGD